VDPKGIKPSTLSLQGRIAEPWYMQAHLKNIKRIFLGHHKASAGNSHRLISGRFLIHISVLCRIRIYDLFHVTEALLPAELRELISGPVSRDSSDSAAASSAELLRPEIISTAVLNLSLLNHPNLRGRRDSNPRPTD